MTAKQIGKLWVTIGVVLLYYALNSWIVSQGGQEVFGTKLFIAGKAPVALVAIIVCSVLLTVNSLIGFVYARRSGASAWHARIPVVFFDPLDTATAEGKTYQATMLILIALVPAAALIHFWTVVLSATVVTTHDPGEVVGLWDWSHFSWNDPARICTTFQAAPIACGQNSTILPGFEPTVLAIACLAGAFALAANLWAVLNIDRRAPTATQDREMHA